jgi:hypothetical protein
MANFMLNDVRHALFPEWFRKEYVGVHGKEPEVHTGEEFGWTGLTTFYHVTQRHAVSTILREGLKVPRTREEILFVGEKEPVPGIYLQEDEVLALDMASIMMERKPGVELSLLRVYVPAEFKFTWDPEVGIGAIVILQDVPPGLIREVVGLITPELINRVVEKGEEL